MSCLILSLSLFGMKRCLVLWETGAFTRCLLSCFPACSGPLGVLKGGVRLPGLQGLCSVSHPASRLSSQGTGSPGGQIFQGRGGERLEVTHHGHTMKMEAGGQQGRVFQEQVAVLHEAEGRGLLPLPHPSARPRRWCHPSVDKSEPRALTCPSGDLSSISRWT